MPRFTVREFSSKPKTDCDPMQLVILERRVVFLYAKSSLVSYETGISH